MMIIIVNQPKTKQLRITDIVIIIENDLNKFKELKYKNHKQF